MKRWKHLRDAFAKSEKKDRESKASGSQATKKRKYIFNDELHFLKKIIKTEIQLKVPLTKMKKTTLKTTLEEMNKIIFLKNLHKSRRFQELLHLARRSIVKINLLRENIRKLMKST